MSPVHVGEVRTEMDAQSSGGASPGGAAGGSPGGAPQEQQGWAARDKHARMCEAVERMKARIDGRGFDA